MELATSLLMSATVENPLPSSASSGSLVGLGSSLSEGTSSPKGESMERPSLSYKDLIIEAIESSPEKRLKLNEIYQVIRVLHPYYRLRPDQWGWQNSIRHNLSLHDCFVKLPLKQTSASGVVGHYWTVVPELSDKQTLRRRSRAVRSSRGSRQPTLETPRESRSEESTVDASPSPHSSSSGSPVTQVDHLPKPTPSYGIPDLSAEQLNLYAQQLLTSFMYQNGLLGLNSLGDSSQNVQLLNPLLALSQLATAASPKTPSFLL